MNGHKALVKCLWPVEMLNVTFQAQINRCVNILLISNISVLMLYISCDTVDT